MGDTRKSTTTSASQTPLTSTPSPASSASPQETMFRKVEREKVKGLLPKAKKGLPESCSVYNAIYMHTKFAHHYEFFVPCDKSLDTIIVWRRMTDAMYFLGLMSHEKPNVAANLLENTRILNWAMPVMFYHLPENLASPIALLMKRKAGNKAHLHKYTSTLYTMDKKRQKDVPLRCPKGYKVCRLGGQGVRTMLEVWRHKVTCSMEKLQEFAKNIPCIGLFIDSNRHWEYEVNAKDLPQAGDEEDPIAFVSVSYNGAMGMLGCKEKLWTDGLMALLVQTCGRMMANENLVSHIYVEDVHVEAQTDKVKNLMDTLPGWKMEITVAWMWSCFGSHCP